MKKSDITQQAAKIYHLVTGKSAPKEHHILPGRRPSQALLAALGAVAAVKPNDEE